MKKEWEVWSQRSEWSVEMTGSQSSEDEGLYEENKELREKLLDLQGEIKAKDSRINRLLKAIQDKNLTVAQPFKLVNKNDEAIASVQEEVQELRIEGEGETQIDQEEGQDIFWVERIQKMFVCGSIHMELEEQMEFRAAAISRLQNQRSDTGS